MNPLILQIKSRVNHTLKSDEKDTTITHRDSQIGHVS